jgi:uncharacterized membrane protein YwzB
MHKYLPRVIFFLITFLALQSLQSDSMSEKPNDPIVFVTFFALMWIYVTGLLGVLSGWPILALKFPSTCKPKGKRITGAVYSVGIVPERNVTGIIVSDEGFYLWTCWMFSIFRPALLIPWKRIRIIKQFNLLWWHLYFVSTGCFIPVVVNRTAYESMTLFLEKDR